MSKEEKQAKWVRECWRCDYMGGGGGRNPVEGTWMRSAKIWR